MTALTTFSDYAWAQALAWTLIHFVWQGALIGLAAFVVLRTVKLSSAARYGVGVAAMTAMLIAPLVTFAVVAEGAPLTASIDTATEAGVGLDAVEETPAATGTNLDAAVAAGTPGLAASYVPFVLVAWAAGVLVLSVRLAGGWWVARRLVTRSVRPVTHEVHAMARRVAGRLALDRAVRFAESTVVAVPVTVGWLKPVVLIPAAAMTGLSTTQVEALVAHELAHVRRHDYLVNLMQSAVETLLFFHPAVWWASNLVRTEREHCCDDLAVGVCDPLTYVSALSDLAAMSATPRLAMAATNGSLLTRVRRILGKPNDETATGSSFVPVMLAALVAAAFVPVVLAQPEQVTGAGRVAGAAQVTGTGVVAGAGQAVAVGVAHGIRGGVAGGTTSGVARVASVEGVRQASEAQEQAAAKTRVEIAALLATYEAAVADLERQRRLFETGLLTGRDLVDSEVELAELQAKLAAVQSRAAVVDRRAVVATAAADLRAEVQRVQQEVERDRQLVDRGLATEQVVREAEVRLAELVAEVQAAETRTESRAQLAEVEVAGLQARRRNQETELSARVRELLAELGARERIGSAESAEVMARLTTLVTDESTRVQERDIVVMRISGESLLPTNYEVDTAGAIRLPLLGALQVRGLTLTQVRAAVTTMLADRQLAEDATITITLRRPRTPGAAR